MMIKKCINRKLLSIFLSIWLTFYSLVPSIGLSNFALAQEESPQATTDPSSSPSSEPVATQSSEPSPTTDPSSSPSSEPQPTSEPASTSEPTPTPSPTPVPMTADEYDEWKKQKELEDQLEEARDDEWELHEEDDAWVAAHGGNDEYYISGAWQRDQDAAAAAAASSESSENALATPDPFLAQDSDPFATQQQPNPQSCEQEQENPDSIQGNSDPLSGGDSGSSASGTAVSQDIDSTNVSNNNCASLGNDSYAGGISGENTQSTNDGPTDMTTGSSGASGQLTNQGNVNATETGNFSNESNASAEGSFAAGSEAENLNTGEDTNNLASGTQVDNLNVDNNNTAYVDNNMTVEGVSGVNTITDNDGNATLTTGDIELIANMLNILNLNITGEDFLHLIVNIFGTLNGTLDLDDIALALGFADDEDLEVIARNENTGEGSTNTASVTREENTNINNTNNAEVTNDMNVSGISGQNDVSGNDGGADVVTGRIKILANLMNFINANFSGEKWSFIMINIFGGLMGDIILPDTNNYLGDATGGSALTQNVNPGEGSVNNSSSSSSENATVTNANGVSLTNNVNADGISGNNQQSGNDDGDGAHTMSTGVVDVATQIMNYLNFNITGNNWVFLIVNVFGKWMGQIVGFADTGVMNAPTQGSFAALSVGGVNGGTAVAGNSNTGEDSVNNASATNTSNMNVNNDNYATVENNMNIEGISGENGVNNNDAGTSLTTGWVEIDANLLNIINMNVTGRSWMIVFLNVFGDFVGNLFFGAPPPPAPLARVDTDSGVGGDSEVLNQNQVAGSNGGSNSSNNGSSTSSNTTQALETSVTGANSQSNKLSLLSNILKRVRRTKRLLPRVSQRNVLSYTATYEKVPASPQENGQNRSIFASYLNEFLSVLKAFLPFKLAKFEMPSKISSAL